MAVQVKNYHPRAEGDILDLSAPAVDILQGLPGAADVRVKVKSRRPKCRIIHISDYHHVPRDLFIAELEQLGRRKFSAVEADIRYRAFLLEVELVQLEQLALLRCLARRHGLSEVWAEGVAKKEEWIFPLMVIANKEMEAEIRAADVQVWGQRGKVKALQGLIAENRTAWLNLGACGRLLAAGDVAQVLGPEDGRLTDIGNAKGPDRTIKFEAAPLRAREDAMVRTILESDKPVAVVVLGGAHDLTYSVRHLGKEEFEYIRVGSRRYQEFVCMQTRRP
jgi:hypothetical protein